MRKVANLAAKDRNEIFSEAAFRLSINPTIIEKEASIRQRGLGTILLVQELCDCCLREKHI